MGRGMTEEGLGASGLVSFTSTTGGCGAGVGSTTGATGSGVGAEAGLRVGFGAGVFSTTGSGEVGVGAGVAGAGTAPAGTDGTAGSGAGVGAGAGAAEAYFSFTLRATGGSMVDDAERTYSPISFSASKSALESTPSSFASSWTRCLATNLLLGPDVSGRITWLDRS